MSLTAAVFLFAFAGLLLAFWVQVRAMGTPHFGRQRRRAGVGLALLLAVLGLVHGYASGWLDLRLFPPEEDGSWGAVLIDGQPVSPQAYYLTIRDRKVMGGRDGCNYWSFEGEPKREDGQRSIHTTMALCAETVGERGYHAVAYFPSPSMRLRLDGALEMAALGHRAVFRRCTWEKEPNNSGSGKMCVVK